eukprot:13319843-Alexandrium_andersonii.AAC.1
MPDGAEVAPEFHNRVCVYTTRSERYFLHVPRDLSHGEVLRRLQEQVADCDQAVHTTRQAIEKADAIARST